MRKVEEEWNTSKWQGRTREQIDSFYLSHGDPLPKCMVVDQVDRYLIKYDNVF